MCDVCGSIHDPRYWLENFHSFFLASFLLAKESETFSWQLLQSFSPVIFEFSMQGCSVILWEQSDDQWPNVVLTLSIYKTPWEEETRNFWPKNRFYAMVSSVFTLEW